MPEQEASRRVAALDAFVELLSGLEDEEQGPGTGFYDRLCAAICRLTSMERAGIMLYDDTRKLVVPVGSHGLRPDLLAHVHGTLEETPIAQRALSEDRVVLVSEDLEHEIPERYARFAGVTTLTCTPVSAGGQWLGVIFADRGGGSFELAYQESHTMWMLGKTAALAASAQLATTQHERAHVLSERIDLTRQVHERVLQRLFGVSLVLGSTRELSQEERTRCASEIREALADLRSVLSRPLAPSRDTGAKLREELERLGRHYKDLPLEVGWGAGAEVPHDVEPLAQSVLAEALRNAHKHARPTKVEVHVGRRDDTFTLEIRNDGVPAAAERRAAPARGAGMGLRLAAFEALQRGGVLEFGAEGRDEWRVLLVVPLGEPEP